MRTSSTTSDARLAGRSTMLAVELVSAGATFVVVGGTAARLRGAGHSPRDLDVVATPNDLSLLSAALDALDVRHSPAALRRGSPVSLATAWCPLDVFVGRSLPPAHTREVDGCVLAVSDG